MYVITKFSCITHKNRMRTWYHISTKLLMSVSNVHWLVNYLPEWLVYKRPINNKTCLLNLRICNLIQCTLCFFLLPLHSDILKTPWDSILQHVASWDPAMPHNTGQYTPVNGDSRLVISRTFIIVLYTNSDTEKILNQGIFYHMSWAIKNSVQLHLSQFQATVKCFSYK